MRPPYREFSTKDNFDEVFDAVKEMRSEARQEEVKARLLGLEIGFGEYGLDEIISFTAKQNQKSQEVMKRIGMKRDENRDFFHPKIPREHPLALHLFYVLQTKIKHE